MTEMTVYVMEEAKEALLIVENTSCVVYAEIHSYAEPVPFAGLLQVLSHNMLWFRRLPNRRPWDLSLSEMRMCLGLRMNF